MFMHFSCICIIFFISLMLNVLVLFCLSISLSLFLLVSCSMAPKCKSTLSRNPLHSGTSSSSSPIDSTPSHVKFHDDKARKDFLKNFSQCSIHLERQVILSDFFDIDLPTVIYKKV